MWSGVAGMVGLGAAMVAARSMALCDALEEAAACLTTTQLGVIISKFRLRRSFMSDAGLSETPGGQLGERRLGTIHAVAQALAIGPMFSTAIVLGFVSAPVTGAGFNTALSVLVAGLGVLAIAS